MAPGAFCAGRRCFTEEFRTAQTAVGTPVTSVVILDRDHHNLLDYVGEAIP
jgi:hypothetical protein